MDTDTPTDTNFYLTSAVFTLTFVITNKLPMEPKKDWSINGVDYSEYEMKCIACVMLGLKPKQMPTCLCKSRGAIKYYLSYVYAKMNIHSLLELALLAPTKGFDVHGCFQGEPVLNPDELSRAYQLRPPIT